MKSQQVPVPMLEWEQHRAWLYLYRKPCGEAANCWRFSGKSIFPIHSFSKSTPMWRRLTQTWDWTIRGTLGLVSLGTAARRAALLPLPHCHVPVLPFSQSLPQPAGLASAVLIPGATGRPRQTWRQEGEMRKQQCTDSFPYAKSPNPTCHLQIQQKRLFPSVSPLAAASGHCFREVHSICCSLMERHRGTAALEQQLSLQQRPLCYWFLPIQPCPWYIKQA